MAAKAEHQAGHNQLRMAAFGIKSTAELRSSDPWFKQLPLMSEVAQHQLLVTLVHGTWPRGFFPMLRRRNRGPLWFEESSPFLARLSAEFGDIPHKIKPLPWSGENSIFARDATAYVLAEYLSAEHNEHPQATQLIIAHSHGGNIALRALHLLQQRDSSQLCGGDSAIPLVVTLATPFVEVHPADFGQRPSIVRIGICTSVAMLLIFLAVAISGVEVHSPPMLIFAAVVVLLTVFLSWYWISGKATVTARQNKVKVLTDATRFGEIVSAQAQRLLVIRAIDDEASLALALGTIFHYVATRTINYLFPVLLILIPLLSSMLALLPCGPSGGSRYRVAEVAAYALIMLLGALTVVSRSVHGRELAVTPMECQINTQSVPDATDLSQIVTLISHGYVKSLRHGIYEHENCARAILDWIRSQR